MENICVVVADARRARLFLLQAREAPRMPYRLAERGTLSNMTLRARGRSVTGRVRTETNTNRQAGPMHPMVAQRERHRIELERRFAVSVARRAAVLVPLLDHNPAAHDAIVEPVELLRVAAHLGFKRGRVLEIAERDLKGYLHVQRVEESLVPRRALRPRTRR